MTADPTRMPLRNAAAAWLLVSVVVLSVVGSLIPRFPGWINGVIAWSACACLWPRLSRRQAIVVMLLVAFGLAGIAAGISHGESGLVDKALAQNTPLIGMLIAVSFLQLISVARSSGDAVLSKGKLALARTLIGVHLFGAVINFSAVAIFADRLTARTRLTLPQAMALSQAFIVGAVWSPFYGAMAVALTIAPNASLGLLMAVGAPVAAIGLCVSWLMLSSARYGRAEGFEGYPLHLESLWVPAVLAAGVLVIHEYRPGWSVLAVIAALAPLVTVGTLLVRDGSGTWPALHRLITIRLPEMGGETSLFLSAGVLAAGIAGFIAALDIGVPFERYGWAEASMTFIVTNLFAWIGFHPVILASVIGPWLAPVNPDPNLVAMTFLMSWGVALTACPMSNSILALHGRYGVPFATLLARNRLYSVLLTVVCVAVMFFYCVWKGTI
ncbi:MAG: hypothetical protein ACM3SS_10460 [Rhodospirillaceae bacterium]